MTCEGSSKQRVLERIQAAFAHLRSVVRRLLDHGGTFGDLRPNRRTDGRSEVRSKDVESDRGDPDDLEWSPQ
jgi:hypothetical protein